MRPPGSFRSVVSSVAVAMTTPTRSTLSCISRSMIRSVIARGGCDIMSSVGGSTPMASAGPVSVSRLAHRIWVASSGATMPPPATSRPISEAATTPPNTVRTSPMLDDSR